MGPGRVGSGSPQPGEVPPPALSVEAQFLQLRQQLLVAQMISCPGILSSAQVAVMFSIYKSETAVGGGGGWVLQADVVYADTTNNTSATRLHSGAKGNLVRAPASARHTAQQNR